MLFNSLDFAIFLPLVFTIYWSLAKKKIKYQNLLIVVTSYIFYGWWDWRFLSLIIFSTVVDFIIGKLLYSNNNNKIRKTLLFSSILINLGFLMFFKYYNFFLENFITAFTFFGHEIRHSSLNIILPVGISFYTFQTMSYTIDVYKRKLKPTSNFIAFAAFVSFFPQLVAGPIERATNLLPQFYKKRTFEYRKAVDGLKQILWGLFKKIVIADNSAEIANQIFNNYPDYSGSTLVLGAIFFTFQIYGDFSGYSDIAIGTSRLFGFNLKQNFAFPYFSRDIAEFWRRWHISLSTWFRDYLYIPLGGSQGGVKMKVRNTFIIFIVSGFWHGANWTYIFWGFLNALYFLPLLLRKKNRLNTNEIAKNKKLPSFKEFLQIIVTFSLTIFAWIFFRSISITDAFLYISKIFSLSLFKIPYYPGIGLIIPTVIFIFIFIIIEWIGRNGQYGIEQLDTKWSKVTKFAFYIILFLIIYNFGNYSSSIEFIYFQF